MRLLGIMVRLAAIAGLAWVAGFTLFTATIPDAAPVSVATDAVVVLTGGAGRLARGVAIMDARSAQRMLVSGVGKTTTRAALAAALDPGLSPIARVTNRQMFQRDVDLGYSAIDTRSNAEETAAWMAAHKYRSLRLVTSGWHMRRAELELRTRLPADITIVTDAVPPAAMPAEPPVRSVAREYSKFVLRWIVIKSGAF